MLNSVHSSTDGEAGAKKLCIGATGLCCKLFGYGLSGNGFRGRDCVVACMANLMDWRIDKLMRGQPPFKDGTQSR